MKLKDQVVSLELAKKLKELGFEQESMFYWYNLKRKPFVDYVLMSEEWMVHACFDGNDKFPAYTVAELGEMLPPYIETEMKGQSGKKYKLRNWLHLDLEELSYTIDEVCPCGCGELIINSIWGGEAKTEADARAKMLIHLAESELLTK